MTTNLSSAQRRDALVAALDWVEAYEGRHQTIGQGARDVPQDLLDAVIVLQDLVEQALRAEYKAEVARQAWAQHPNAAKWQVENAAKKAAEAAYPTVTRTRLTSTDAE